MRNVAKWMVLSTVLTAAQVQANDVEIVHVVMSPAGTSQWRADVTLRHADAGWDHYADAWRVVTEEGTDLGTRTLLHPHVAEQPFTRSLSGIAIAADVPVVFVEAHDKVHGWSGQRVRIDLRKAKGDRFEVRR